MYKARNLKSTFSRITALFMLFICIINALIPATSPLTPKHTITKQEALVRKKKKQRIAAALTAAAGIGTAAWYFTNSSQPAKKQTDITFKQAQDTSELKQILHKTTYAELTTTLHDTQSPVPLAEQKTSYIEQITLKDGSVWFLKVAKWPGRINKHGTFNYVFGSKQNRSRYDMAKKINQLKMPFVHAPKKKLIPLKDAGPDKSAWTDKECVVLAPQLPAGSLILPPATDPHFTQSKKHFLNKLREYIHENPEALEQFAEVINKFGFADSHLGNIALLPNNRGLMIYNTEDVLQGIEESDPSASKKIREQWSVNNFLGRTDTQPGIERLYLGGSDRAQQVLKEWQKRKKALS